MERVPKDVIMKLALELDDESLKNYCLSSKRFNQLICDNYLFWINKILKDFNWLYKGEKTLYAIRNKYNNLTFWWNPTNHRYLTDRFILEIPGLLNLTSVNARDNPRITDKSISKLKSLITLNATFNKKITDDSVKELKDLKSLGAGYNPKITDISVKELKGLTSLDAGWNPSITDDSVKELLSLKTLNASYNPKITDKSVKKLLSLTTLSAYGNPNITIMVPDKNLPNLVKVDR